MVAKIYTRDEACQPGNCAQVERIPFSDEALGRLPGQVPGGERKRDQAENQGKNGALAGEYAPSLIKGEASGDEHYDPANAIHCLSLRRLGLTAPPPNPYRE